MASVGNVSGSVYDDLVTAVAAGTCSETEFDPFIDALIANEQLTAAQIAFFEVLQADIDNA